MQVLSSHNGKGARQVYAMNRKLNTLTVHLQNTFSLPEPMWEESSPSA
jgi:hypothetical protein